MSQMLVYLSVAVAGLAAYYSLFWVRVHSYPPYGLPTTILSYLQRDIKQSANLPPIIPIPENEIYTNPREAYEKAFEHSGTHVIGVRKKGRLEFIVDDTLVSEVLTNNTSFSFEDGVMTLLNMKNLNDSFTDYFTQHDDLVKNAVTNRLEYIINKVFPVFMKNAERLVQEPNGETGPRYVDALDLVNQSLCEAMTEVILGPDFLSRGNIDIVRRLVKGASYIAGLYQNTSWWGRNFPNIWRIKNWVIELCTSIPLFYGTIGLQIWRKLKSSYLGMESEEDFLSKGSVLDYLALKYTPRNGNLDLSTFFKITGLISGNLFASIHLTATVSVWVLFELALHPEFLLVLHEELTSLADLSSTETPVLSYEAVQNAVHIDSFIREVMRTKGDILSVCRMTRHDVKLNGYTIPKGHLVLGLTTMTHLSTKYHGNDAEEFKGDRWVSSGKRATTIGKTFLSFGLGRWACPGRTLAISEIKMLIWSIICRAKPILEGNSYKIVDKLEVTARAPRGKLILVPYSEWK